MTTRGSDQSPATIIPSSSPEFDTEEDVKGRVMGLKGLRFISADEMTLEERALECRSPEIPIICPVPVRGK